MNGATTTNSMAKPNSATMSTGTGKYGTPPNPTRIRAALFECGDSGHSRDDVHPLGNGAKGSRGYFSVLDLSSRADEQHHQGGGDQQHPRKHEGFEVGAELDPQHASQV